MTNAKSRIPKTVEYLGPRLEIVAQQLHRGATKPTPIKSAPFVDRGRYTGERLREIRARTVNFKGEVQR